MLFVDFSMEFIFPLFKYRIDSITSLFDWIAELIPMFGWYSWFISLLNKTVTLYLGSLLFFWESIYHSPSSLFINGKSRFYWDDNIFYENITKFVVLWGFIQISSWCDGFFLCLLFVCFFIFHKLHFSFWAIVYQTRFF